jgi:hypothetical protein
MVPRLSCGSGLERLYRSAVFLVRISTSYVMAGLDRPYTPQFAGPPADIVFAEWFCDDIILRSILG